METTTIQFGKGMNNRLRVESIPEGFCRNASNVQFDENGKVERIKGVTKLYSGVNIHSFTLSHFIEGDNLKRLNDDNTAKQLSVVGSNSMGITKVDNLLFFGNSEKSLVIDGDTVRSVGVTPPEQQPILSAKNTGGMFAGEYQVAITYLLPSGEESGTGVASQITLSEGQGIQFTLSNVPDDIDKVAVYVSSVNDSELWLYDEVDSSTTEVFIDSDISSVRIETQFVYPPLFSDILQYHYGRIYWADGNLLRYTQPLKYGQTKAGNYEIFSGDITLIVSLPQTLYICADKTYKIVNIDGEGFKQRVEVLPYGAVKGTLRYDSFNNVAYWQSFKGFVMATVEGAKELLLKNIAMPEYSKGTMTMVELDGRIQLISVSQGGESSKLMDSKFKAEEILRIGSAR